MNPSDAISWICHNQELVTALLAWAFGLAPVASAAAWLNARHAVLPDWMGKVLQILALNLVHAAAGEPK